MTKEELLRAARGIRAPFEFQGFSCLLKPLPWGEFKEIQSRHRPGDTATGEAVTCELIARSVCDEAGASVFDAGEVAASFPLPLIEALSEAIAKVNGVGRGNASAPTES